MKKKATYSTLENLGLKKIRLGLQKRLFDGNFLICMTCFSLPISARGLKSFWVVRSPNIIWARWFILSEFENLISYRVDGGRNENSFSPGWKVWKCCLKIIRQIIELQMSSSNFLAVSYQSVDILSTS